MSITLSRRERQILDVLYRRGRATASEIREALPDAPSYSAVRALLRILEEKKHIRHQEDGPRYVYMPMVSPQRARADAVKHLLTTFFGGSAIDAAAAFVDGSAAKLTPEELDKLEALIERQRDKEKTTQRSKEEK